MLLKNGNNYSIADSLDIQTELEPGYYILNYNQMVGEFELNKTGDQPKTDFKIYGNTEALVDIWALSYERNKENNVGILLKGVKGTGKTLACRLLCEKLNLPVILITQDFGLEIQAKFTKFLNNPEFRNCIVFIDEFEKIYERKEDQNVFLQILDGSTSRGMHQIFLFTVNEDKVNEYFENRPGRILFSQRYTYLTEAQIKEFCLDNLDFLTNSEEIIAEFVEAFERFGLTTYDILSACIKMFKMIYTERNNKISVYDVMSLMNLNQDDEKQYAFKEYLKTTTVSEDGGEVVNAIELAYGKVKMNSFEGLIEKNEHIYRSNILKNQKVQEYFLSKFTEDDKIRFVSLLYSDKEIQEDKKLEFFNELQNAGLVYERMSDLGNYSYKSFESTNNDLIDVISENYETFGYITANFGDYTVEKNKLKIIVKFESEPDYMLEFTPLESGDFWNKKATHYVNK